MMITEDMVNHISKPQRRCFLSSWEKWQ